MATPLIFVALVWLTRRFTPLARGSGIPQVIAARHARDAGFRYSLISPRVAFGTLVETGMIAPGTQLACKKGHYRASVRADGSLVSDGRSGSIHKLGAMLQEAPSCNGWTFWHFEADGKLVSIDLLRQKLRAELAEAGLIGNAPTVFVKGREA